MSDERLKSFYRKLIITLVFMLIGGVNMLNQYKHGSSEKTGNQVEKEQENPKEREARERQQLEDATDYTPMVIAKRNDLAASENDAATYVIFACQNGDVFMSGEEMAFFPFEKITTPECEDETWLFLTVAHKDTKLNGFPTIYDEKSYPDLYQTKYDYQKISLYDYFETKVTRSEILDGYILLDWNDSQVVLQKICFRYVFESYTMVQAGKKHSYRLIDGTPVESYLDIPHSRMIDQEKPNEIITLTIK